MNEQIWALFSELLKRYGSLSTALEMLCNIYPKEKRLNQLVYKISAGEEIHQALNSKGMEKEIGFYSQFCPLANAIDIAIENHKNRLNLVKLFVSNGLYHLIVLFVSLLLLSGFSDFVLPKMMNILEIENETTNFLFIGFKVLIIIKNVIFTLSALILTTLGYIILFKRENYLWVWLHKYNRDGILRIISTYQFVDELGHLSENGIPFDQAINIIRLNDKKRLSSLLAFHLNGELLAGKELEEAMQNEYVDKQFYPICLLALQHDDFNAALKDYKRIIEHKLKTTIQRITVTFQLVSYGLSAIIIVLAYQVLLLPLDLLENI